MRDVTQWTVCGHNDHSSVGGGSSHQLAVNTPHCPADNDARFEQLHSTEADEPHAFNDQVVKTVRTVPVANMDMLPVYSENDPKYKCFPCVCINYKIGALIVAGVELALALVICILVVVYVNFIGENEMQDLTSADVKKAQIVLTLTDIVVLFLSVFVAICLLLGVIRQNVFLLIPYMIKT
uniref:Uncharacterized protein n=1 Tax=Plectus sambesii TaxID=2011161 RepID=A0A914WVX0_9BILA